MGTRRHASDGGGSLDSLLDTLTNVVGILVILLALARIDVSSKVRSIQGVDSQATPEALALLRQSAAELAVKRAELAEKVRETDPEVIEAKNKEMLADLERIQKELAASIPTAANPDELKRAIEELEKQLPEKEADLNNAESTVAEKRARLAEIRPAKDLPAKIVRLPNPRAPPENLKPVLFVCRNERVSMIDTDEATKYAVAVLQQKAQTGPERCDCEKASALFDRQKYGSDEFRLRIKPIDKTPYLVIEHIAGKGTTARQVDRSSSAYAKELAKINPSRQYARFLVWPDSYEVYLAARDECDRRRIAAGWQPFADKAEWQISLAAHYRCDDWVPPPPAPAKPPANPAAGPAKPTPVDTVD